MPQFCGAVMARCLYGIKCRQACVKYTQPFTSGLLRPVMASSGVRKGLPVFEEAFV